MTTPKQHRHKAALIRTYSYQQCVAPRPARCKPEAHGNVTEWQQCACGATRVVNVNYRSSEASVWLPEPVV